VSAVPGFVFDLGGSAGKCARGAVRVVGDVDALRALLSSCPPDSQQQRLQSLFDVDCTLRPCWATGLEHAFEGRCGGFYLDLIGSSIEN
jgi:hypothetical protein